MEIGRRNFLFGSAAVAAFAGCSTARSGVRPLKEGEKRKVAMIGCGIQMRSALIPQFSGKNGQCKDLRDKVEIVAVCDCDRKRREDAAKTVDKIYGTPGACLAVADFREILANPEIDMVCIATPDHWHAYISVEAMKHGKDVYCEKPLTFSVEEARAVAEAQEKYGRVFQTGSMQRSWREFRDAVALVRGGAIGNVMFVDANYGKGGQKLGGPSHPVRFWDDPANAAKEGAPNPDVDWDMWLGPAMRRPYSDQLAPRGVNRFYPMFWRFDDDIGSGYNGDWGAHHLDIAQWGLDADRSGPVKILRSEEPHSADLYHGGRRQFGMKMVFAKPYGNVELYHGPFGVWGTVFYGTDGIVAVNRGKIAVWLGTGPVKPDAAVRKALQDMSFMPEKLVAASVGKDYGTDATQKKDNRLSATLDKIEKEFAGAIAKAAIYVSPNQVVNFVECCETRAATVSPAETGARSCVLCLLCNTSYKYDTGFDWDPVRMDFANGTGRGIPLGRRGCCNGWKVEV